MHLSWFWFWTTLGSRWWQRYKSWTLYLFWTMMGFFILVLNNTSLGIWCWQICWQLRWPWFQYRSSHIYQMSSRGSCPGDKLHWGPDPLWSCNRASQKGRDQGAAMYFSSYLCLSLSLSLSLRWTLCFSLCLPLYLSWSLHCLTFSIFSFNDLLSKK